eukprot:3097176-Rhodomonas_salina.1
MEDRSPQQDRLDEQVLIYPKSVRYLPAIGMSRYESTRNQRHARPISARCAAGKGAEKEGRQGAAQWRVVVCASRRPRTPRPRYPALPASASPRSQTATLHCEVPLCATLGTPRWCGRTRVVGIPICVGAYAFSAMVIWQLVLKRGYCAWRLVLKRGMVLGRLVLRRGYGARAAHGTGDPQDCCSGPRRGGSRTICSLHCPRADMCAAAIVCSPTCLPPRAVHECGEEHRAADGWVWV